MARSVRPTASTIAGAVGLGFGIAMTWLQQLSVPGGPSVGSYAVLAGLTITGYLAVAILLAFGDSNSGRSSGGENPPTWGSGGAAKLRTAQLYFLAVFAIVLSALLLLELAIVPVGHYTASGPDRFEFSVGGFEIWNHTIQMPGFGQIVFNWSELPGYYQQLHVTLTRSDGVQLCNVPNVSGYEGFSVAPGTYWLVVTESTNTVTMLDLTLQTAYYSSAALL